MESGSPEKKKRPLPGYRFFFNAFGLSLVLAASWMVFELVTVKSNDSSGTGSTPGWFYACVALWFVVGAAFLWYAHVLATAELTIGHWKLGWFLIPLGVVTGFGIFFLFMALIWGDADVKANFRKPKPNSEPDSAS